MAPGLQHIRACGQGNGETGWVGRNSDATAHNKKVAAFARFTRSGERGTEAAPATSERYGKSPMEHCDEKESANSP